MLAVKFMMRCNPVYENQVEDLVFRLHMGLVTTVELERIRDETRQLLQAKDASIEQLVETMGKMSVDKQALTAKINQVQSAFPIESFSEPKVIRCLIQPVLRLLSSLLTLPNGCMLREDFVTDVEEMLVVDLEDFKLPKVVTTVGSYTAICSIVKARHFAYNQTPEEERRSITSSAINVDQFAFLLHRFQGNITPSRPM